MIAAAGPAAELARANHLRLLAAPTASIHPSPAVGVALVRAIRETRGTAVAIPEAEIEAQTLALARRTGLDICPEGGAVWAALLRLRAEGFLRRGERVVLFNTGTGLKYR